jgi:hypothetical protein
MTIAGQLSVTASDDPRFSAGDSIGIVIDSDCTVTVTQNVEVSAPSVAPPTTSEPTEVTPATDPTAPVDPGNVPGDTIASADEVAGPVDPNTELAPESVAPATE